MVDLIKGYNLWKFQIDILQIEARMSVFVWQKFFRIFIKIRNIEICNRLFWVCWYHENRTYPLYWNEEWPSSALYRYDLINKGKDWQYGGYLLFRDIISLRGAVANFNIAETPIFLRFQYCLDDTISLYKGVSACFM